MIYRYFSPSLRKLQCLKRFQPHSDCMQARKRQKALQRSIQPAPIRSREFYKTRRVTSPLYICICIYARKFCSLFNNLNIYFNPFLTHVEGVRTLMLSICRHIRLCGVAFVFDILALWTAYLIVRMPYLAKMDIGRDPRECLISIYGNDSYRESALGIYIYSPI